MMNNGAHIGLNVLIASIEPQQIPLLSYHGDDGGNNDVLSLPMYRSYRPSTSKTYTETPMLTISNTMNTVVKAKTKQKSKPVVLPLDNNVYISRGETCVLSSKLTSALKKAEQIITYSQPITMTINELDNGHCVQIMCQNGAIISYLFDENTGDICDISLDDSVAKCTSGTIDHALLNTNNILLALNGTQLLTIVNPLYTNMKKLFVDKRGVSKTIDGPDHNVKSLSLSEDASLLCIEYSNRLCIMQFDRRTDQPRQNDDLRVGLDLCGQVAITNSRIVLAKFLSNKQNYIIVLYEDIKNRRYYINWAFYDAQVSKLSLVHEKPTLITTIGLKKKKKNDGDDDDDNDDNDDDAGIGILCAVMDNNDEQLAIARDNNTLLIVDVSNGGENVPRVRTCIELKHRQVSTMIWHPSNVFLVVLFTDNTICLYDRVLQSLRMTTCNGSANSCMNLTAILPYKTTFTHVCWGPNTNNRSFNLNTLLVLGDRGPLIRLQFHIGPSFENQISEYALIRQRLCFHEYQEIMNIMDNTSKLQEHYIYLRSLYKQLIRQSESDILGRILKHVWPKYESPTTVNHSSVKLMFQAYARQLTVQGRLSESFIISKQLKDYQQLRVIRSWANREGINSLVHIIDNELSSSQKPRARFPHLSSLMQHPQFQI